MPVTLGSLPSITGWQRKRLFDWVMVRGESGLGARLLHPDWVWSLQKQCEPAGTAFWFKQWGEWIPMLGQRHGIPVKKDKYQFPVGEVMDWLARRRLATCSTGSSTRSGQRHGRGTIRLFQSHQNCRGEWEAWG